MLKRSTDFNEINDALNIKNIDGADLFDIHYALKIRSYLNAYGAERDFCGFYITENGNGCALAVNSLMVFYGDFCDIPELVSFISLHKPARVELPKKYAEDIAGYAKIRRTMYKFPKIFSDSFGAGVNREPNLDGVYEILAEGFPNIMQYELWLADTSHRIRHGVSKFFTYREATAAAILYDINGHVQIGQVATKTDARGQGLAKHLLFSLGAELFAQGKTPVLYALDIRRDFYENLGFIEVGTDSVMIDNG